MKPVIDHIQVTVRDMDESLAFYDAVLPLLGYDLEKRHRAYVEAHDLDVAEYLHPGVTLGINSPRKSVADEPVHRRKPGAVHHIAFRATSREEVDRVAAGLRDLEANIVGGPKLWPEHGKTYYAVFFKDPSGIKLEVVHCEDPL
jgi:catechol 2,3-dioxygenase-like lactoylglutathione lyase family enzyme